MRKLLQRLSETVRPSAWKPPLMLMTALLSLFSLGTFAQTTLLSGTSSEGSFEGASLSADGWTAVQSATNYWVNGTALASHGSKSAFITNDGTTNGYNNGSTQANHIYKDFTAPVGENIITITFDLKGNPVDVGFDRFRVYVAPITATPVAGTEATSGATQLFSFDGNLATFTGQTAGFSTTTLGSQSFRVILTWRNDGSVGVNPPYAVDKVNITSSPPSTFTATAQGGLWSNGNTWVGGVVPVNAVGNSIVIPAGSVVTVDQVISYADYTINGTLYWNNVANAMSASGNVTIGATGRFLPYTTSGGGATVHCLGNFTNNGYANLYLSNMNFTGTGSQTFGGTGTYQGNGVKPTISAISRNNTGTVNVGFACNVGTLNSLNGTITGANNIELDYTKRQVWAEPTFTGTLSQAVISNMGAGYSVAPVVGPASAQLWVASQAVTTSAVRVANGQVYVCSVAGTTGATAPSHTSGTAADGTATWLWVGAAGSVGTAMTITAITSGTQYFYGDNLYTCTVGGTPSAAAPPTHTSGIAVSGTATLQYVGSAAKISLNYDATNLVIRSANITTAGSGYVGNPTFVILTSSAPTTTASLTLLAYHSFSVAATGNAGVQKSGSAVITGTPTIVADGRLGVPVTANGGRYAAAPAVGVTLPNGINLAHLPGFSGGSGYTGTPTVTVVGGTAVGTAGTATAVLAGGRVIGLTISGTWSSPPTGVTFTGGTPTVAASTNGTWTTELANRTARFTATLNATTGQINGFTIVNAGSDYVSATIALGTAAAGEVAATTPTVKAALYNLSLANFANTAPPTPADWTTPATQASVPHDEATNLAGLVPSGRKWNNLTLGAGLGQVSFTGNVTLFGTAPLTLGGGPVNMGGNALLFQNSGYLGNSSSSVSWVYNGTIQLNYIGTAAAPGTRVFPFRATGGVGSFRILCGTGTAPAGGSNITQIKVEQVGAPSGSSTGAGTMRGSRAYKVDILNGAAFGATTQPTVDLYWDASDNLVSDNASLFISQSNTGLSSGWTARSVTTGTGGMAATGSRSTATTTVGPIVFASTMYFGWSSTFTAPAGLNYSVSRTTGNTYNSIASIAQGGDGTGTLMPGITQTSNNDDLLCGTVSLAGTTFQFQGTAVTGFKVSTNSWLTFNTAETASTFSNGFASAAIRSVIAPYWDDTYHYGAYSNLYYKIVGTLGSGTAKIIVEWYKYSYFSASGPELYYQVVLDENGNKISINYGNMQTFNGTFNRRHTYSMGLGGSFISPFPQAGEILALQYENTTAFSQGGTLASSLGANALSQNPEPRSSYIFTPGVYVAPSPFTPVVSAPVNDNVGGAVSITPLTAFPSNIAWDATAARSNFFSLKGATQSPQPVCGGPANPKDVWFKFNANDPNIQVRIYPSAGMTPVIEVLDASLNPLAPVSCNVGTTEGAVSLTTTLTGLTVGDDYYVRVYNKFTGTTAQVTAILGGSSIAALTTVTGGTGYPAGVTTSPTTEVTLSGGGGVGAVVSASNTGGVLSFALTNGGLGYSSAPTITVNPPDIGLTGEFGIIVFAKPANDDCSNGSLLTNIGAAGKIGAVALTGGSVTSGSSTLTVASTAGLGTVGSQWVLNGPFVDPNTIGTVASATDITLSSAATGTGSGFGYTARQNTYSAVSTGAATLDGSVGVICPANAATSPDDDVWYKFVATAASHSIAVVGKGGFDPVIDVKNGNCAASVLECTNATAANATELLNLTGLTIGQTYNFRVYHAGTGSPIGSSFDVSVYTPLPLQYQFAQSNGSYSAISGGTVLGSGTINNAVYKVVAGANKFRFNTLDFDSAFVSANGFVMLNESPDPSTLYPLNISGGGGALAAFAADLEDAAGAAEIRYQYVSPEHVFQWSGMRRSGSTGEDINFQIRMNSTTGDVKYVYGASTPGTGTAVTVCGIRNDQSSNPAATAPLGGFKAINVMNRTTLGSPTSQNWSSTTTGTTLTSAVGTTASSFPVSGLTFTYSSSSCNPYTLVSTTIGNFDKEEAYSVNWRRVPGSQGYVLRYRKSTEDNLAYTSINVGSVDTDTSYTFAANTFVGSTYYLWDVLSVCGPTAAEKSHASNTGIFNTKGDPIAYDYAVSAGTYTEITGGTVLISGSIDDNWGNHSTSSPFEINGAVFTEASVNTNGFLVGGTLTLSAATYAPLASLLGLGLVSPMGEDLSGLVTGVVRYEDVGAEHVWQWKDWSFYSGSGSLNFQARYNKSSKVWKFVYGTNTFVRSTDSAYVGIRAGANQGRRDVLALSNRIPTFAATTVDWTKMHTANRSTQNAGGASWPNTSVSLPSGTTVTFTPITCGGLTMAKMPVSTTLPGEDSTIITKTAANDVKWYRAINANAASNGYKIRYRDTDDPESVATWATPINTGSGPNDTTYNFTGLKPGATVIYQIAGRCDASNRGVFGGQGRFNTQPADFDIEFAAVVGPSATACFSASTDVTVRVSNQGVLAVGAGENFNYTINIAGPVAGTLTGTYTTTAALAPGASVVFSVGSANMATAGAYTITGNIAWTADEKTNNNDLGTAYAVTSYTIVSAPATYNLDAAQAGAGFAAVNGTSLPSYRTTAMTNPTLAIQEGSGFVYWNSFSITSGSIGRFVTPCINIPTNCYEMKFFHSRDNGSSGVGADEGTVVRVSTDGGLTWSAPKTIRNAVTGKDTGYVRRYFAPATTAEWQEFVLDLGEYNGQNIKVAFDMTSRFGNNFGIDNVRFTGKAITNDLSYETVVSPESFSSCGTSSVPVVVRVRNTGCQSYSNIGINLLVSGAGTSTISNVIPGPLDGGQFINFTVGTVNMTNPGNYILDGNLVVSDQVSANNNLPNTTIALIAPPQLGITLGNANAIVPATTTLNGSATVGAPTVAYANTSNVSIADGPGSCPGGVAGTEAISNIVVGATVSASSVQRVIVNITHSFCEDLRLRLQAPNGSFIDLVPSCTAGGSNYIGTNFVASGAALGSGTGPYSGDFAPDQSFSLLTGSANGTWSLIVTDHYSVGTGTINNWSIQFANQLNVASWTCPTCPAGFPVNFSAPVASVAFPNNPIGSSWAAGSYDITLAATDLLGCANSRDTTFNLFSTNIWLGINDGANNWSDAANWIATPAPPTATQEITIPAGTPFPPKANAAVTVGTVNQNAGSDIQIAAGGQLNVAANWVGNGGTTSGDGTVNFNSSGAQSVSGTTGFNNLTVTKTSGTLNITGTANINGTLTLANGTSNITVPPTGNLVIASNASGTGRIAAVPSGAAINGNVRMERYLPWSTGGALGQWFFLSSPILGRNFTDWVDDFKVYGPASGFGGQGGGIIQLGPQHSTILGYTESLNADSANPAEVNGWKAPSGNITNGAGYRVYVDKYSNSTHKADNLGSVKTGLANFPVLTRTVNGACTPSSFNCDLTRTGWNLIGNPYPSPINWDAASGWTKPGNLQAGFWRYNATLGYGAYVSGLGWTGSSPAPTNPNVIPSSQGFFVRLATGTSGNLAATENVKTGSGSSFLRTSTSTPSKLKINLNKADQNGGYFYSGVVRFMDEATDGFDPMLDFSNLASQNFYFSFPVDNAELMVNSMGSLSEQKIVPLNTRFMGQSGNYSFTFEDLSTFNAGVEIFLKDKYFNTIQSITGNPEVAFEVNAATMSMTDRFELIFNPVPFTSVKGLDKGQFFGIHPNPSNGASRVTFTIGGVSDSEGVITIVDMLGKVVFTSRMDLLSGKLSEKEIELGLPSGVYNVKFNSRHSSFMDKLVVR